MEQSCVARYGGIRSLTGRNVVVGLRAEDVHPASARPELPTLDASVELVEALGSGLMATSRSTRSHADRSRFMAPEPVENRGSQVLGTQPNLVAHFRPRIDLQIADTVPVAIDPGALHFFDEDTGAALT